jgi:RNA polymerase sigma factor (sigma-70 family)
VTEKEAVRLCKKGNSTAQRRLYDIFANRYYRLAFRYVKNQEESEDLVMMSFVKIFKNLDQFTYRGSGSLEAWMRKIVVNEALMVLRKKHNFYLIESLDTNNPDHDIGVLQELDAEYLYQMILELPDGYRTVFNLNVIEGYDHREIARLLGITEGTSRSQLYKAKELLKRKIRKEGIHYGT